MTRDDDKTDIIGKRCRGKETKYYYRFGRIIIVLRVSNSLRIQTYKERENRIVQMKAVRGFLLKNMFQIVLKALFT